MAFPSRHSLFPFLTWLPRQTRASVGRDLIVGLSGAILALPQSIAYALIAGLPPEYGLYAAIIPVLIACLWGSSWHLICGPTAAISIVLYASVSPLAVPATQDYVTVILLLTFLAGVFQWLLGLLRFGALVNFVSHSVVLGFTLGAAVVIAVGQLPNLLGLDLPSQATALDSFITLLHHLGEVDKPSLMLGLATVVVGILLKLWLPRWPTLLITLVLGALLVWLWPSMFGRVQLVSAFTGKLPPFSPLPLDLDLILRLLPSAVAVGMLGLVTSLSIARSISARSQQLLDANQEVRAQGLSNIVGAFFFRIAVSRLVHPFGVELRSRGLLTVGRDFFSVVGGAVCDFRREPDCTHSNPGHGRQHPVDRLGTGGPSWHSRAAAGQPSRVRGHGPDLCRHAAAGVADSDLRRGVGVAVLLPQAHLATAGTAYARRR
jgi:SulP family sulfate permease